MLSKITINKRQILIILNKPEYIDYYIYLNNLKKERTIKNNLLVLNKWFKLNFTADLNGIVSFINYHKNNNVTNNVINNYLSSIFNFYEFQYLKGIHNDIFKLKNNKLLKLKKNVTNFIPFNKKNIILIENIKNDKYRLLFQILLNSGLRISECLDLKVNDIKDNLIYVRRVLKTNNSKRKIVIKYKLVYLIEEYIQKYNIKEFLFHKNKNKNTKLSYSDAISFLNKFNKKHNTNITFHSFRHYYALKLIKFNINEIAIMQQLGHASTDMLNIYINYDKTDIEEAMKDYLNELF